MALVHEKLYAAQSAANIDFADYVGSLMSSLLRSHGGASNGIKVKLDLQDTFLDADTAIPCGLLLNELVSNALRHAFPGRSGGQIRIGMRRDGDSQFTLQVSDDGVGLPKDVDLRHVETLGLRLVNTLVEQLCGSVEVDTDHGTHYSITFRVQEPGATG
jgi:two-component sensor histidine kinase